MTAVIGVGAQSRERANNTETLRNALRFSDLLAVLLAWTAVLSLAHYPSQLGMPRFVALLAAVGLISMWAIRSQGLLEERIAAVRTVEVSRLVQATALLLAVVALGDRVVHLGLHLSHLLPAGALSLVCLLVSRWIFRSRVRALRARGRFVQRVVLLSAGSEARRAIELFAESPGLGIRVEGVVGDHAEACSNGLRQLWLGELRLAETIVLDSGADGVVVLPQAMSTDRLNELVRIMHAHGVHVHLGTGLSGIAARRMHTVSLAYEPFLYVECPSLSRVQTVSKRAFDIAVSASALLVLSPLLAAVAVAVRLSDGGPVLFGQERVGRNGKCFRLFKFRSMHLDAEQRLHELRGQNQRTGPLFKIDHDPRVTRIGNFLRLSSLDELPQLWNVLRGEMSLVGPRPALPAEVALFPPELRARELVTPGISGLWQVEARDNPSFEAYRRLDLFYVENFSLTLDLVILLATFGQCRRRVWQAVTRRPRTAPLETLSVLESVGDSDYEDLESATV